MKARIRRTGEIIDVKYAPDTVRGCENTLFMTEDKRTFLKKELDFDFKLIDWEQRRYEIAKDVMQGILFGFQETREEIDNQCQGVAKASIVLADALIKELKGE